MSLNKLSWIQSTSFDIRIVYYQSKINMNNRSDICLMKKANLYNTCPLKKVHHDIPDNI